MTFLDIIEIYNIQHGYDVNDITKIFDGIELDSRLDKELMAGVLLDRCGALNSVYNVTATFKYFSDMFFKKYAWNITKLANTLEFQYDPLKNRTLSWTETTDIQQNMDTDESGSENRNKDNTGTQGNVKSGQENGTFSNTASGTTSNDVTETNTVSAMNSSDYEPDSKRVTDADGSVSNTESGQDSNTKSETSTRTDNLSEAIRATTTRNKDEELTWDETDTHTESGTENVAYQDLIEKERRVAQFSIYDWIAKKYANELFLLVY